MSSMNGTIKSVHRMEVNVYIRIVTLTSIRGSTVVLIWLKLELQWNLFIDVSDTIRNNNSPLFKALHPFMLDIKRN